jgi:hypothetical protein
MNFNFLKYKNNYWKESIKMLTATSRKDLEKELDSVMQEFHFDKEVVDRSVLHG